MTDLNNEISSNILYKYMKHVINCEGVSFLHNLNYKKNDLTESEIKTLKEIEQKLNKELGYE